MNLIWQTTIFVALGTAIVTAIMMGTLLLGIQMQKEPEESVAPNQIPKGLARKNRRIVTFEVDGKRVNLRIDVSDASAVADHQH